MSYNLVLHCANLKKQGLSLSLQKRESMKIANPLYDHAFKYLMSNDRLAKKVLSTIMDKEVLELEPAQQEIVIKDDIRKFTLYRLDFKALIRDENGKEETVLIEIQKSKLPNNVLRFRNYLGMTYSQKSTKTDTLTGLEEAISYPIVTIYILGYQISDIPFLATKIDRKIINVSTKEEVIIESDFINLVTHTCYILQAGRLPAKRQTRIEEFMTLFNQAWVSEEKFILDLEEIPEQFKDIAEYLQTPLQDSETVQNLEAEQEFEQLLAGQESKIAFLETIAEEAKAREEEERRQKEEALALLKQSIKALDESGLSIEKIAAVLGKTVGEIERWIK